MIASSAPRRVAVRTASMATLPPPTTATRWPLQDRRVGVRAEGAHEVDAGQVLVGRVDALEVLAGDVHEDRQAGADGHEDGVELLAQLGAASRSCR